MPQGSNLFISFGEIDCRHDEGFIIASAKLKEPSHHLINRTVEGFVKWFATLNRVPRNKLYFFNVPAPVYNSTRSEEENEKVASVVSYFNNALENYCSVFGNMVVDVYSATLGPNGFSNENFHIDGVHLDPSVLSRIEL